MAIRTATCERCARPVNCGDTKYCYCGAKPPPVDEQDGHPGYTTLIVCEGCFDKAMEEGTNFVCRKRFPNPPVTQKAHPSYKRR